ncbi:hypothetical protein GW17_00017992 [Ensete ventricosum]|nr:hypothetical protein GW17_00017992 [Ensete ventricosum]
MRRVRVDATADRRTVPLDPLQLAMGGVLGQTQQPTGVQRPRRETGGDLSGTVVTMWPTYDQLVYAGINVLLPHLQEGGSFTASSRPSSSLPCPPPQLLPPAISSAGHHLPFSFSIASTTASLALSRNHRWAHLTLTPLPPPSPVLGHRSPASRHHKLLLNCCRSRVMPSCRNSRLPLPSLTVGYCLLPPAPIADAVVDLLLRLLPTACRYCQLSATAAAPSSNLLCFLQLFHPLLPLP